MEEYTNPAAVLADKFNSFRATIANLQADVILTRMHADNNSASPAGLKLAVRAEQTLQDYSVAIDAHLLEVRRAIIDAANHRLRVVRHAVVAAADEAVPHVHP